MTEDKLERARSQGRAQYESIRGMVRALRNARSGGDGRAIEAAEDAIRTDPLCVEVRSRWFMPNADRKTRGPFEYRILLCTGGPAVQVAGELDEHGEPETARLEIQDWLTPWTDFDPTLDHDESPSDILIEYASQFWFGE